MVPSFSSTHWRSEADHPDVQWKYSREILRRQLARIHSQDMAIFEDPIKNLLTTLSNSTGQVDLQPEFFRFTLATTVSLLFGESLSALDPGDDTKFAENFNYTSLISAIRLRLADLCFLYNLTKYQTACAAIKQYASCFVSRAIEGKRRIWRGCSVPEISFHT